LLIELQKEKIFVKSTSYLEIPICAPQVIKKAKLLHFSFYKIMHFNALNAFYLKLKYALKAVRIHINPIMREALQ
jgi:hypothetical protein